MMAMERQYIKLNVDLALKLSGMVDMSIGRKNMGVTGMTSKDENEIFYAVKGHLIPSHWSRKDIDETVNSYIKRLWGNCERLPRSSEAFEKAWEKATRIPFGTC